MNGEKTKNIVDAVASHPKTAGVIAVAVNEVNMRFTDYEPIVKVISSTLGMILVSLLIIKASIDIYKSVKVK
jgi:hypothetical protein